MWKYWELLTILTFAVKGDMNDTAKKDKRVLNRNSDKYQRRAQWNLDVYNRPNIVSTERRMVPATLLST